MKQVEEKHVPVGRLIDNTRPHWSLLLWQQLTVDIACNQ